MEISFRVRSIITGKLLVLFLITAFFYSPIFPAVVAGNNVKDDKKPRKRALLIGISKYQRKGGGDEWTNLNTDLDIELLKKVLIERFRFASEDIIVLQNERATKAGILGKWSELAEQTQKGDVLFVHFSGHGESIPDDNGDEIDGKDESLIPFDYVSKTDKSKNIRDDEIGKILDKLKKNRPANVTVSIDSCYSGTATRGDYAVRGGGSVEDSAKPESESPSGLQEKDDSFPKEYVFLAASSPRQTAKEMDYEDKGKMGVFTHGLVKALSNAAPHTTYRDLFENLNNTVTTIRRDQNPQLEGSLDEIVFDGTAVKQEQFTAVRPTDGAAKASDTASLQTGKLLGATVKSRYGIYDAGTKNPNDKDAVKIADGEIIKVDAVTSVIKLNKPVEPSKLQIARAFETRHNYEDSMLKVVVQNVEQVEGGKAVRDEFVKTVSRGDEAAFDLAEFREMKAGANLRDEIYDVKIYPAGKKETDDGIVEKDFRGLILERKDGSTLAAVKEGDKLNDDIKAALERENRYRIVKSLDDAKDSSLNIELRVIPIEAKMDEKGNLLPETVKPKGEMTRGAGGQAEVKVGDLVTMEVVNNSSYGVYVTILNLQADGTIAPGFPQVVNGRTADNFVEAGQTLRLPKEYVFTITKPLGEESFRAIATVTPTDFTPLIEPDLINRARGMRGGDPVGALFGEITRGSKTRGDNALANAVKTPLGRILLSANVGKRTGIVNSVPPSWTTSSFTYLVKDK